MMLNCTIAMDVHKRLSATPDRPAGPDGVSVHLLRSMHQDTYCTFTVDDFSTILISGQVPYCMERCNNPTDLLYKGKGEKLLPSSYISVSLCSVLGKIFMGE